MNTPHQHHWGKRRLLFLPIFLVGLFVLSAIVLFLWNAIIPAVTGVLPLTYWQAMGLLVLCRILFGGFRFRGNHAHHQRFMHQSFRNKFMDMNDEEREQFQNQWKKRCCK